MQIYLRVPFSDNEEVKGLGGRWDARAKQWYVPSGVGPAKFERWMSDACRETWRKHYGITGRVRTALNGARKRLA